MNSLHKWVCENRCFKLSFLAKMQDKQHRVKTPRVVRIITENCLPFVVLGK